MLVNDTDRKYNNNVMKFLNYLGTKHTVMKGREGEISWFDVTNLVHFSVVRCPKLNKWRPKVHIQMQLRLRETKQI